MNDAAHNNKKIRQPIADQWAGQSCTLNGLPAKVTGRLLRFAVVATEKYSVEYSWEAVDSIMKRDRKFSS